MGAVGEAARHAGDAVKPRLRGWLHLGTAPLALAAGIVLVVLAPDRARFACAVYAASSALLFGISAAYHRGHWSPRTWLTLKRLDHANIFLIIAGSYTPFAAVLLHGRDRVLVLTVVWLGALVGIGLSVAWPTAPRWLLVPVYVGLGWVGVLVLPQMLHRGGGAVLTLVVVGGVLYSLGGFVYGARRPNPWPRWFGFHEVFHALTVAAWTVLYVAASLAVYTARA